MCMEKNTISWEHINIKHITVKMPPYGQKMFFFMFLKPGYSFIPYKCQNDQSFKSVQSITMRAIIIVSRQTSVSPPVFPTRKSVWMKVFFSFNLLRFFTLKGKIQVALSFFFYSWIHLWEVCVCVGVLSFVTPMLLSDTWMKVLFRLCAAATTISETRARSLTGFPPNEHHQLFFFSQGAQARP